MEPLPAAAITLGILAGGRASRLGGIDKAWLVREGMPQVLRWPRRFADETGAVLVSANRDLDRYRLAGLRAVTDRAGLDLGPIAGLDALASACTSPWLLTVPVDLVGVPDGLLSHLVAGATDDGAAASDDDGPQPLVALWRVAALRDALASAIATRSSAVHLLQASLRLPVVHFAGVRLGNLNTPDDLAAAGVAATDRHHDE
ncbi:molybdenum cofactor guanylyltransferase [Lysobacter psychrotolerans]|uniref:Molybdenum cofactor guanylyltransferase n=1 Tax=Montanilutibacter psychrotolerans TaxID=1327343 RepID=A0A3M8SVZ4_9GAMM|nr:molybdenum cofactor guanylyltransferase [Lysobacter psychrotolerans]